MSYPKESLLRPPIEWCSSCFSTVCAGTVFLVPNWLWLNQALSWPVAACLLLHAAWRFKQGLSIVRYHQNLKRLKRYLIVPAQVPISDHRLFLGRGFAWDQRHTQRLSDAREPSNEKYTAQGVWYKRARAFEQRYEHSALAKPYIDALQRQTFKLGVLTIANPVAPLPPVGGDPKIHGVELNEQDIWMDLLERAGHTLVLGTTRVGKTRLAELFIAQDIRRGDVVIVFDPKGDADLLKRMYTEAKRAGREDEFMMFHLGYPDISARYNPIGSFSRITEVATRIAGQLPSEGQSAAFKEFVWRFVNVMSRALVSLGQRPDYQTIYQNAVNLDGLAKQYFEAWFSREYPGWETDFTSMAETLKAEVEPLVKKTQRAAEAIYLSAYARQKGYKDPIADSLASMLANDRSYFEKLVSSLYPLLEKLTTGKTAELLSPDYLDMGDSRPIFDWMSVINKGGIVYVGLDSLSDFEVAGAVGNAMFADLTSIAGQIYKFGQGFGQSTASKKRKICVHADEFNELIGDEFIPLLNKAGGAGYNVTVYTQTWSDVEAKIGSAAKAGQIGGNLNTLFMLRVKNLETAEILTNQLPDVKIIETTLASGATDTNDPEDFAEFGSKNEDRQSREAVPMISPADLIQLPKGQCFALIEGGQLRKLRLPLFDPIADFELPATIDLVAKAMQNNYRLESAMEEPFLNHGITL
jgi:conjugative coupling factor TraD (TOL family)